VAFLTGLDYEVGKPVACPIVDLVGLRSIGRLVQRIVPDFAFATYTQLPRRSKVSKRLHRETSIICRMQSSGRRVDHNTPTVGQRAASCRGIPACRDSGARTPHQRPTGETWGVPYTRKNQLITEASALR
jgi:hypothetical protein